MTRKQFWPGMLAMALIFAMMIFGCDSGTSTGDSGSGNTYTVTFNSNGGSSISTQTVNAGSTVARPANPSRSGYTFVDWYSDSGLTAMYIFGTPVNSNITLYAKWIPAGSTSNDEGIYIGIIKFAGDAEDLTGGAPILLNTAGKNLLTGYLNSQYTIATQIGTAIFYAVHKAMANLKSNETRYPGNLDSVNIITFTDGLDLSSDGRSVFSPLENKTFNTPDEYADFITGEITNRRIAGNHQITAYSVGVRGGDVTDYTKFRNDLTKIASPAKFNELTDFGEVQTTFNSIADGLNITHTNTSFTMVTAMLTSEAKVRMTFDAISGTDHASAAASAKYIEGTINRTGTTYTFNNITYAGGISSSVGVGPITGTINGSEVNFLFNSITGYDINIDRPNTKQWIMFPGATTWQFNSEYKQAGSSTQTVENRSTVIYLVLDCSTSLSMTEISQIRTAAINFINTLYSKNNNNTAYTVTFNANGGSGTAPSALTTTAGSAITLPSGSGLTRSGYTFGGWNTNTSGTGTNYNVGVSYTPTDNVTLYAKWNGSTTQDYTVNLSGKTVKNPSPFSAPYEGFFIPLTLPNNFSLSMFSKYTVKAKFYDSGNREIPANYGLGTLFFVKDDSSKGSWADSYSKLATQYNLGIQTIDQPMNSFNLGSLNEKPGGILVQNADESSSVAYIEVIEIKFHN